jgi:hypothetical protein
MKFTSRGGEALLLFLSQQNQAAEECSHSSPPPPAHSCSHHRVPSHMSHAQALTEMFQSCSKFCSHSEWSSVGVLGFGFWVLGFGFWILGFGFWVSGSGSPEEGSRHRGARGTCAGGPNLALRKGLSFGDWIFWVGLEAPAAALAQGGGGDHR